MKTIESTKTVWLDGVEYTRVFFVGSDYFEDIETVYYPVWLSKAKQHGDVN